MKSCGNIAIGCIKILWYQRYLEKVFDGIVISFKSILHDAE